MTIALEKPDITATITKFCFDNCEQVTCILLYGSYATGSQRDDSDVDIIVIDEACIEGYRKQHRINGYLIQATISNFREALNRLCESPRTRSHLFPNSYHSSVVLLDRLGQGAYLKNVASQILKIGPIKPTPKKIETQRMRLLNYLGDGSLTKYTGKSTAEKIFWGAKVVDRCQDFYLLSINEWTVSNIRFKNEALINSNPELKVKLYAALSLLMDNLDTIVFAANIQSIMSDYMSFDENSQPPYGFI